MRATFSVAVLVTGVLYAVAPPSQPPAPSTPPAAARPVTYPDCVALRRAYPHGVGLGRARDSVRAHRTPVTTFARNDRAYQVNAKLDTDHDGIACEHP